MKTTEQLHAETVIALNDEIERLEAENVEWEAAGMAKDSRIERLQADLLRVRAELQSEFNRNSIDRLWLILSINSFKRNLT